MMNRYPTRTLLEKENALKEICQEIILYGLSQTNFFSRAAMYGGTAMRLFLGLDRFSEDLDFVIKKEEPFFAWETYSSAVKRAFASCGLEGDIVIKKKSENAVSSAFFVETAKDALLLIYPNDLEASKIVFNQKTKIKFEVSLNPNPQAHYQQGYLEYPTSFGVSLLDPSSLFSGKICAILYRDWKSRAKGRDFYDFAFYVRKGIKPNVAYLQEEIRRKEGSGSAPDYQTILLQVKRRFHEIDFEQAKKDVLPFIQDSSRLGVWGEDYFSQLADKAFSGK